MVDESNEDPSNNNPVVIGVGFVIGSAIGAVGFAITSNAVWVGLGSGVGLMGGVVLDRLSQRR